MFARVLLIQCFPDVEFPVHPQFALQAGLAGKIPQVKFKHIQLFSYLITKLSFFLYPFKRNFKKNNFQEFDVVILIGT